MISEKTIKSVIRKILVEQASPPGAEWSRIAASQKTKFENDGCTVMKGTDNKWYYKPSTCNSSSSNTSELPEWVADYPCISELTLFTTSETNKVYEDIGSGGKWYYFEDGTFKLESNGVIKKGKWKCENGDKLRIRIPNSNQQWTEAKGWHAISNYTKCPETLPIKQWCKNDTIKQVQACLGMPKRYLTGNFGQNTQEYLESRKQDGKIITTQTIINVCGPNDPLITGSSGSSGTSGSGSSGTSGSGSSGTSGSGSSGTSGSGKVVTGYEDYVKDEIPEE